MDHTFFDFWAERLEWEDADIIEMVATGVEGRSECERATVLMMHHKGVREKYMPWWPQPWTRTQRQIDSGCHNPRVTCPTCRAG